MARDVTILALYHPLQTILTILYGGVCDVLTEVDLDDKVCRCLENMFTGDGPYGRLFAGLKLSFLNIMCLLFNLK